MSEQVKVGLLPFFLQLYDQALPELRPRAEEFVREIAEELKTLGLKVCSAPLCCVAGEFQEAVTGFVKNKVDAIVTLHTAYSPSLESAKILSDCNLPILVLNTTPDKDFGFTVAPEKILLNHGIHGVQDLCNLLQRYGKEFFLESGHYQSGVLERIAGIAVACNMRNKLKGMRVGLIGQSFKGMGDFAVPEQQLQQDLGIEIVKADQYQLGKLTGAVTEKAIKQEIEEDRRLFASAGLNETTYFNATRTCLALRSWLTENRLGAFSMNFLTIDGSTAFNCVPFLEAGKGMARGIGYAGEGDVLTAALTGVLASRFPQTSFAEMFCPDWHKNFIFLNHMGEANCNLLKQLKLVEIPFPYTAAENPVIAAGRFRKGEAMLVNLAPLQSGYNLLIASVSVCEPPDSDKMPNLIRGWIRPRLAVADFLTAYSRASGTHHLALVYEADAQVLKAFGQVMGWQVTEIPGAGQVDGC